MQYTYVYVNYLHSNSVLIESTVGPLSFNKPMLETEAKVRLSKAKNLVGRFQKFNETDSLGYREIEAGF